MEEQTVTPEAQTAPQEEKSTKKNILQFIKYALIAASAGVIQVLSFTLLNEVVVKMNWMQNLMENHETFGRIMANDYGPCYLIALILSVIWNFTFNRKYTFKSANNIPIAMLKVFGYYVVFTPVSTLLGNYFTAKFATFPAIDYIVLGITMVVNMVTEFLFQKFVVFRGSEGTAVKKNAAPPEKASAEAPRANGDV
ncbi:MAG: GtrA family protein [Clostridia bacterium]|nr:GtrA family protein [Clostridia bacterium]MBR3552201.1 GtrA family protein [Clostridia bacterium]